MNARHMLWLCAGLELAIGALLGTPLALAVAAVFAACFVAGAFLHRRNGA